jgi:hypothetical protein
MRDLGASARGTIRLRRAAFDFASLLGWQRSLMQAMNASGVTSYDVDEVRNQVVVGIERAEIADIVMQRVREMGIPDGAVVTTVEPAARLYVTLRDSTNRMAGLQISRSFGTANRCTMGPLILMTTTNGGVDSTTLYFVTNSHCSASPFAVDNSYIGQPTMTYPIGYEIADPTQFNNAISPLCPASDASFPGYPVLCRTSDASLYVGTSSIAPAWHGTIAVTPGDNNIDISDSWSIANSDYPYAGQTIHKTGMWTGTSSGSVQHTCKNVRHDAPPTIPYVRWMLCQGQAVLYSGFGDSGSPIVRQATGYSGLYNPRTLVGLLWGGVPSSPTSLTGTTTYFSPWPNVNSELGGTLKASR